MRTNTIATRNLTLPRTHEGSIAKRITPEQELRRSVMACLLWEGSFYESGVSIADRIIGLVPKVNPDAVAAMAVEAREEMKLRHVPLLLCRELAKSKSLKADTLSRICKRADEPGEFLALYSQGRTGSKTLNKLSKQVQKGLAKAMQKFDAYQLAKYNRDGAVKLKDVLFLTHAKPKDESQAAVWKQLIDGTLPTPDTWEVALSGGSDKRGAFVRLLSEKKLGALALLRNLRNMVEAKVPDDAIRSALREMKTERVLPFRFITAARYAPKMEDALELAMFKCLEGQEKLPGKTVLLVDCSGSMDGKLSEKSELSRRDAASGLAILLRESCDQVNIISFSDAPIAVPPRRGFALRDAIAQHPSGGTHTDRALELAEDEGYDRIIVITDEQSHQQIRGPKSALAYFINVSIDRNGIGYGAWTHFDGWSESIVNYIRQSENQNAR